MFRVHQDKWDELFADPGQLGANIEELVRWASPAGPTRNVTAESITVGGIELPRGERLYCPLGAGNRDPQYFPDPDEVRFDRAGKPHLSFGLGPHRCVGVHLARAELRIAFEELRAVMPHFHLANNRGPREHIGLTWGIEDVHLVFEPRR